jgi:hypothetical protein
MTFIHTVPPDEAAGLVKEHYERDLQHGGYIANSTRALSLRPEVFSAWRTLIGAIRANMDRRRYELVTVIAASRLRCTY